MRVALEETVSIYGMFSASGRCLYIGQSRNPLKRQYQHLSWYPDAQKPGRSRILAQVPASMGGKVEALLISEHKARGECLKNTRTHIINCEGQTRRGYPIFIPSVNRAFSSKAQAARMMKLPIGSFYQSVKEGKLKIQYLDNHDEVPTTEELVKANGYKSKTRKTKRKTV